MILGVQTKFAAQTRCLRTTMDDGAISWRKHQRRISNKLGSRYLPSTSGPGYHRQFRGIIAVAKRCQPYSESAPSKCKRERIRSAGVLKQTVEQCDKCTWNRSARFSRVLGVVFGRHSQRLQGPGSFLSQCEQRKPGRGGFTAAPNDRR